MAIDNTTLAVSEQDAVVWICKPFAALTKTELYAIMRLRSEVFVVEQNCVYLDADGIDLQAFHLCAWQHNRLLAYCRIISPGQVYPQASIGRVVVPAGMRRTGIGALLVKKAIENIASIFGTKHIRISAQYHLLGFYKQLGFTAEGKIYDEDGIPHIAMIHQA